MKSIIAKFFTVGVLAVSFASIASQSHAWTTVVGAPVGGCTASTALDGGSYQVSSNEFLNNGLYTYRYDLSNVSVASGVTTFTIDVSKAVDKGTSGLTFFFGTQTINSASPYSVYHISNIGNDVANGVSNAVNNGQILHNTATWSAYFQGNSIVFTALGGNKIDAGSSFSSEYAVANGNTLLSDYFYVQSKTAPSLCATGATDASGQSTSISLCGPAAVPEPTSAAAIVLGVLALSLLALRGRRRGLDSLA